MTVVGDVLVDGVAVPRDRAAVSVFDIGFQRGYGCFETMRSYGGHTFRMGPHLDRLEGSAQRLRMSLPPRPDLEQWCADRAAEGDVAVKLFVTGGRDAAVPGTGSVTIVFAEELPELTHNARLLPVAAPWHPDGRVSELTGAKTLSYAPNIAARLAALDAGFDDALLVGSSGHILEGPTSGVGWIKETDLFIPAEELGVLASVTVAAVAALAPVAGLSLQTGHYGLDDVLAADEVLVMSTLSEIRPVAAVGDHAVPGGEMTQRLALAFAELVAAERSDR